jgi:hypothetical protein
VRPVYTNCFNTNYILHSDNVTFLSRRLKDQRLMRSKHAHARNDPGEQIAQYDDMDLRFDTPDLARGNLDRRLRRRKGGLLFITSNI